MERKRLIGLVILVVILVAIPVTIYLTKQTQIFKPKAENVSESRVEVWQGNPPAEKQGSGSDSAVVTDPNVQLKIYYVPSPAP